MNITDFSNELEEVSERVFERLPSNALAIRLTDGERRALKKVAQARGMEEVALVREWVREKLHHR